MADKEILRFKNTSGGLITPITKISAGTGVTVTRKKDLATNTYDDDEIVISATGSGSATTEFLKTTRETDIVDGLNPITSAPQKTLRLDTKLKLRDETITFGGCYTGDIATPLSTMDAFTMFFHKVTI
jgi:hypothetical protein